MEIDSTMNPEYLANYFLKHPFVLAKNENSKEGYAIACCGPGRYSKSWKRIINRYFSFAGRQKYCNYFG